MKIENYQKLRFVNDFMFAKVMRNRRLCKHLLEVILEVEIESISYLEEQKTIDHGIDARSVRLDVYVRDEKQSVYNIEMQASNPRNLPKRSRYYQGMIDLNLLQKGEDYNQLKKSYVIFICTEDIFQKKRAVYTFENLCIQDSEIRLGDETIKVFLNPISEMDDIGQELKNFLTYIDKGIPVDDFTRELEQEVEEARQNRGWEEEYMTLQMIKRECFNDGKMEGRTEGRIEGKALELITNIEQLRKNLGLSLEAACQALGISLQEYENSKKLVQ